MLLRLDRNAIFCLFAVWVHVSHDVLADSQPDADCSPTVASFRLSCTPLTYIEAASYCNQTSPAGRLASISDSGDLLAITQFIRTHRQAVLANHSIPESILDDGNSTRPLFEPKASAASTFEYIWLNTSESLQQCNLCAVLLVNGSDLLAAFPDVQQLRYLVACNDTQPIAYAYCLSNDNWPAIPDQLLGGSMATCLQSNVSCGSIEDLHGWSNSTMSCLRNSNIAQAEYCSIVGRFQTPGYQLQRGKCEDAKNAYISIQTVDVAGCAQACSTHDYCRNFAFNSGTVAANCIYLSFPLTPAAMQPNRPCITGLETCSLSVASTCSSTAWPLWTIYTENGQTESCNESSTASVDLTSTASVVTLINDTVQDFLNATSVTTRSIVIAKTTIGFTLSGTPELTDSLAQSSDFPSTYTLANTQTSPVGQSGSSVIPESTSVALSGNTSVSTKIHNQNATTMSENKSVTASQQVTHSSRRIAETVTSNTLISAENTTIESTQKLATTVVMTPQFSTDTTFDNDSFTVTENYDNVTTDITSAALSTANATEVITEGTERVTEPIETQPTLMTDLLTTTTTTTTTTTIPTIPPKPKPVVNLLDKEPTAAEKKIDFAFQTIGCSIVIGETATSLFLSLFQLKHFTVLRKIWIVEDMTFLTSHLLLFTVATQSEYLYGHMKILCRAIALLLHYLFIVHFTFVLLECILVVSLVNGFISKDILIFRSSVFIALGFGLPVMVPVAVFATGYNQIISRKTCWLEYADADAVSILMILSAAILAVALICAEAATMVRDQFNYYILEKDPDLDEASYSKVLLLAIVPLSFASWFLSMTVVNQGNVVFATFAFGTNVALATLFFFAHVIGNPILRAIVVKVTALIMQRIRRFRKPRRE